MSMANYDGGFTDGVSIRNLPIAVTHSGKIFYVNNSTVKLANAVNGNAANSGKFNSPFATIQQGIDACTADRGDIVYVMPGHAESIVNATTLILNKAGVSVIGLGRGEKRPIITFATATTADITVTAANCRLSNIVFKCNIASQDHMILVTADDTEIDHNHFREGTGTGLNFVTIGAADADSDRTYLHHNEYYMPTAGNGDHAIEFLKDMANCRIEYEEIDGDFDEGGILLPAAADACANLQIRHCNIKNRLTNVAAISISGTGCSGLIQNCLLRTDTQSSALDNGSLATDNVRWADETDQVGSTEALAPVDSVSNALGVNDADNAFSSSSVVANVDGSVLERLEALMDPLGGYDPYLGFRVTKTSNLADGSGTDNLFTVTGRCLITHLSGEVTTVIGGAATMKLTDTTNTVDLCAATTIDSDAVGTMYALPGLSAQILNGTGGTPVVGSVPNVTTPSNSAGQIIGDVQAALTISHILDAADTGAVAWVLYYKPLTAASSIVAAA